MLRSFFLVREKAKGQLLNLQKEMSLKDCKVLKLRPDSSIAKEIENSNLLKKFIETNGKKNVGRRNNRQSKRLNLRGSWGRK